jgi:hypothetical protein
MTDDTPLVLPDDASARLWAEWVLRLLDERYGVTQHGSSGPKSWSATLANGTVIQFRVTEAGRTETDAPDEFAADAAAIAADAHRRTLALDYGSGAWWKASFSTDMGMSGVTALHFMRIMSEHNRRRYQGDWRFGSEALLSFDQAEKGAVPVVIPKFNVRMLFRVPAPGHGPHSSSVAEEVATFLRAASAFATAAPLQVAAPIFPAQDQEQAQAQALLPNAPELPVEGEPLWAQLMSLVPGVEQFEAFRRAQGAMFAYEQAISQESEYVTLALLVSALEALSVPNAAWQMERVSARFIAFCLQLCPEAIDVVMKHVNFAQAFGGYSSAKRFLRTLYGLRSKPLHTGFLQHRVSHLPAMGGDAGIRVALLSEIVRAAVVAFMRTPFSSLIGHPAVDQATEPSPN